tara:strand:- start:279 stop:389 length:111 start_codon:yes stop_codon:yes gene_type:complete
MSEDISQPINFQMGRNVFRKERQINEYLFITKGTGL